MKWSKTLDSKIEKLLVCGHERLMDAGVVFELE